MTFLAPPSSGAKELLAAEPSVAETVYFGNSGSELRRGLNQLLLIARLRRRHFRQIWILDRTIRPALAAKLAGIPERIGLGLGPQRRFITNPGIDQSHFHDQPIDWLIALMAAMNVPLPTTEPDLPVPAATLARSAKDTDRICGPGSCSAWAARIRTRIGRIFAGWNSLPACAAAALERSF